MEDLGHVCSKLEDVNEHSRFKVCQTDKDECQDSHLDIDINSEGEQKIVMENL